MSGETSISRGPLGALPKLSATARLALIVHAVLAVGNALALITQAWTLSALLADIVLHQQDPRMATEFVLLIASVTVRSVLGWGIAVAAARAAAGVKEELRAQLISHVLRRGPEWITDQGPAELGVLATKGLDALDNYFTKYVPALVSAAVVPLVAGIAILYWDWPSAAIVALTVPLIPIFAILIGKFTERHTAAIADASARLTSQLLELLRTLPVLVAFGRAAAQDKVVTRLSDRYRKLAGKTLRIAFLSALVLETVATLSVALVAVDIGLRLVAGQLTLATGLMVLVLIPECYVPLRAAGAAFHASEDGLETIHRVDRIISLSLPDKAVTDCSASRLSGSIRVDSLRVARRNAFAPDGVSFTVRPGEITRLSSASGSGKSTIISVLLGFTVPASGEVTIGDRALSDISMDIWREQVAWVPQRPMFTADTVAQELVMAVAGQEVPSRAEMAAVTDTIAATHLLNRSPTELSTGERQRVAIARALLRVRRGAQWLLLDEPTAHLDRDTAGQVMSAIKAAANTGVGVLLATHRAVDAEDVTMPTREVSKTLDSEKSTKQVRLRELLSGQLLLGIGLGAAATGFGIALTATAAWLIAKAAGQPPLLTLSVAIVAVRVFGLGKGILRYAERLVTHDAAFSLAGKLRLQLWHTLVRLGPVRAMQTRQGDEVQRLTDDTDALRDLVPRVLSPILVAVVVSLAVLCGEFAVLPLAGVVLAVALCFAGVFGPIAALRAEQRATTVLSARQRLLAGKTLKLFEAAADLIACGADREQQASIAAMDAELAASARKQAFGAGIATAVMIGIMGLATVSCLALAMSAANAGTLDPVLAPIAVLVCLASYDVIAPLPVAAQHRDALTAAYGRLVELQDEKPLTGKDIRHTHGQINLDNVEVCWPGSTTVALRTGQMDIPTGTHVAVVGPSGAGKSTLFAVLLGFLPLKQGSAEIPERVAWCPQEPYLASTTVRENLRLGDPAADDAQLDAALAKTGLPRWGERLDTMVGVSGMALSGGQAQRIALARTLLRADHADLVLLDEPTAHLDEPTARAVLSNLRQDLRGKTVLHITHRPAEIEFADLVLEVNFGTIQVRESKAA